MLAGQSKGSVDISVKWDGAPAVFVGIDPSDGKFFVAKKGIFNKNPKVYKNHADIDADTQGDLNQKLKVAFDECSKLGIKKGVIQGDIMFINSDLKSETIDGVKYVVFQPNTIAYAFEESSNEAKKIRKAKIGIAWHTSYSGNTFEDMSATFGVDVQSLKSVPSVWSQDAMIRDVSGQFVMTKKETDEVTKLLSEAGKIFQKIAGSTLRRIEKDPSLAQTIEQFNNTFVRRNEKIGDTKKHVEAFIKWINEKYQKEIDSRKSEAGKTAQAKKRDEFLEFFSESNKKNLQLIFDLQKAIVLAKETIINKLSKLNKSNTFVLTQNGYRVTGDEGFVAIDRVKGGAVKLVDRLEFSTNNFSPDIIKGWQSVNRK